MIIIGSDHGGFQLKKHIIDYFEKTNIKYFDAGCYDISSCDYPEIAQTVAKKVISNNQRGILICGTGIGMSIAANKIKGIRAAVCGDCFSAKYTVFHNDTNILCLGERVIGKGLALEITKNFIYTNFSNEQRHIDRIQKIQNIENNNL